MSVPWVNLNLILQLIQEGRWYALLGCLLTMLVFLSPLPVHLVLIFLPDLHLYPDPISYFCHQCLIYWLRAPESCPSPHSQTHPTSFHRDSYLWCWYPPYSNHHPPPAPHPPDPNRSSAINFPPALTAWCLCPSCRGHQTERVLCPYWPPLADHCSRATGKVVLHLLYQPQCQTLFSLLLPAFCPS